MTRAATHDDVPDVIELGRSMHGESWYRYMPFDDQKLGELMHQLVDHGFLWVHESGDEIDGVLAGFVAECWFSHIKIAGEFGLFVYPDRRGGIAAVRLVEAFKRWATEQGAWEITLGISTGVRMVETGRLYERLGFECVGGIYKMRIA